MLAFLGDPSSKEPAYQCRRCKRRRFDSWVGKLPWKRAWPHTLAFLPGESLGQRSLVSCMVSKELDTTKATEYAYRYISDFNAKLSATLLFWLTYL